MRLRSRKRLAIHVIVGMIWAVPGVVRLSAQNGRSPAVSATPGIHSFVLAENGDAFLYDDVAGIEGVPFLRGVYKSFGFSSDFHWFLYLKADGKFPTFALYSLDLRTGREKQITDAAVHDAAWSPVEPLLAYLWLDPSNRMHVSTYDMASGRSVEIAAGQLKSDFLEWSPDGAELLYITATGLTQHAAEDGLYSHALNRYSIRQNSVTTIPAVEWAQFSGNDLVVLSQSASLPYRSIPNPQRENLQKFALAAGQTYAEVTEAGRPAVKQWNPSSRSFDTARPGQIFLKTSRGVVIRRFTSTGAEYEYASNGIFRPLGQNSSALTWKIPFAGTVSIIQGGQGYVDGSCDGAACFVGSHGGTLAYALDWQQMPEKGEGNAHVLATADATVAAVANNVTCNSATSGCSIGWDNYSSTCADNGGAGDYVVLAHLDGSYSLHAHLRSNSIQVVPGQNVLQGTYLADQGHSGVAGSYNQYLGCGDHLHFSRQIGVGIWEQSIPTDFLETPCLTACRTSYSSSNVELAPAPALAAVTPSTWTAGAAVPVVLTGSDLVYGSTVNIGGTGITASGVQVLSPTRILVVLTIPGGTAAGPYAITVTSPNGTSNAVTFNVIAPATGGGINGSVVTPSGVQNLTAQGTSDWAHWGLSTPWSLNHKAVTVPQIGDYTVVGSGVPARYTNDPLTYSWSDGAPAATASTTTGISVSGQNNGFRITAPADTTPRTLTLYVGVLAAQGTLTAQLSDGSASNFVDTSLNSASGLTAGAYTLTYSAASAGQTLVVNFTQNSATGSVTLEAAALTGGSSAPDFSLSVTPPSQGVLAGNTGTYVVGLSALSGFSNTLALSVSGLPAGVTAGFSPGTIAGGGASTLTVAAGATTAPGVYPLTVIASDGILSHSDTVNLTVIDFAVAASPSTRSVIAGSSVTYTITAAGPVGSAGSISFGVSGLPAGATASFSPAAIAPGSSSIMTIAVPAGTAPGSYTVTVTGSAGTMTHNANVMLGVTTSGIAGSLAGSQVTPSGTAQLTTDGTLDWAHWGLTAATDFDHKAGVAQQIGNLTVVGGGNLYRYSNNSVGFTWTDGIPNGSVSNSTTGIFTMGLGAGFSITVPADTTVRTLKVYVGAFKTQGRMVARLSDGSAPDYVDTSVSNAVPPTTLGLYTFTYSAASSGQTLTVIYTQNVATANGNVTIQAATLAGPPDFTVSATPSAQTVAAGRPASFTTTVSAIGGFSGSVGLTVSGLPNGITAAFTPASVIGGGSSTLALTTTSATVPGTYALSITGTSGSIVHSTTISLTITPPATGGTLSGSMITPAVTAQLTTEGTSDWAHWGLNTVSDFNHKAGVAQQISNYTLIGSGMPSRYANNAIGFTWTDGTPTASATNSTTGIFVAGQNNGFRITVPADTTARTLRLYVGAWRTQGRMSAQLSDGSAPDYLDTSLSNSTGPTTLGVYTFTYSAGSSGQTLTIVYTQNTATAGNITIQAATLASGTLMPDFSISPSPAGQSVVAGSGTTYTATIGALNGYNGSAALSVNGVPSGVSATFNPAAVTGSGSATMTVTTTSAAAAGTYPLVIMATSGNVSHAANATLVITDYSVAATPASANLVAGDNAAYTVNVTPVNGFGGTVTLSAAGLPGGATAAFNPSTVAGSGSSALTVTTTGATPAGSYPLTITGTTGSSTRTANVTLVINGVSGGGTLTGTGAGPVGPVQLTTEGTSDWAHWGLNTAADFDHKTAVTQQIGNFAVVGTGTPTRYANNGVGFTWTDGTPTASATNSTTGLYILGQGQGFRLTLPADTSSRTLRVYVGAWRAQARMIAHLSDGSAPDYSDGSLTNSSGVTTLRVYTFTYSAASAGQTLTVTFTQENPTVSGVTGNVTLQAASLATAGPPDYSVSATPGTQSVVVGAAAAYAVSVAGTNGFAGNVGFSVAGLPVGVTAAFSPATVTGSGSSTMTVSVPAGTGVGNYSVTITATSGSLIHTANASFSIIDFSVTGAPSSQSVTAGGDTTYSVSVTPSNGFTGTTALTVSGLPAGVTASFSPATVTGGSGSSTLTVTTSAAVAAGSYPLTVTGTSGGVTRTAGLTLTVTSVPDFAVAIAPASQTTAPGSATSYTVTINPLNGFAADVSLSIAGLPSGVTAGFNPATVAGGSGSSVLSLNVDGAVPAGSYALTVNAVSGALTHTAAITLAVADFSLSATPASQTAGAGGSAAYTVTITALSGFAGTVSFSTAGLPAGATASFAPATVAGGGSSVMTVNAGSAVPGNYSLTITGVSGTLSHTATATLAVSDFSLSATPASQAVAAGATTPYTITVSAVNGFSATVSFSVAGLPAGATAAFAPATVAGTGSSTMSVTTTSAAAPGSYPLTITGASGGLGHTANVTLVVTDFSVSVSPASQSVAAGGSVPYAVTLSALNGFTGSISLNVTGLPAGVTASFSPATVIDSGSSTLTLNVAGGTSAASYPLTVVATSGGVSHSASIGLTVTPAPDFSISATPSSQSAMPGGTVSYAVAVSAANGFTGDVGFSAGGLPTGTTASFSPASVIGGAGSSTLTLTTSGATPTGSYPVTVTATSGSLGHTATVTLKVADFSVSITPGSQAAVVGGSTSYSVSVSALNGFTGNVGFNVAGLPPGVSVAFSPATVTGSGSSTMLLTTSGATAAGTYPLTITATSAGLSHTANATLSITDFSIAALPASSSVVAGGSSSFTTTVTGVNGFAGSVTLSAAGLPAGAGASFSPATLTGGGSSTMTVTTSAATLPGSYSLTVTASSGGVTRTASVGLGITAPPPGGLTGSGAAPVGPVQLTAEGTSDWAHWGLNTATDFNHKAAVTQQISNFAVVGTGTPARYANNAVGFTWTDGTPTATATNSTTGVYITGQGQGFRLTLPADTTSRTLRLYVGAWRAQARMTAHLSDGSAPDYSDGTLTNNSGVTTLRVYMFTYTAASPGQTLTVTFTQENPTVSGTAGNVALQAATLSGGAQPPDFTLAATPASQTVAAGNSTAYTVSVTPTNGFAGTVGFNASGLPAGVTAAFSPSTITGSGSATMTLTVPAGTVSGTYPITVNATSASLSHTASVNLTVTAQPGSGVLSGSASTPSGTIQLTMEGTADWADWGLATATDFNHKASVTPQISNFAVVGTGTPSRYSNNSVGFTWTDGTPTSSATNTTTGVFLSGQNNGFRITVPADTTVRTLRVYVGAWRTQGSLVAHLSDGSALDYTDTSVTNSAGVTTLGVYTLTYHAASAGQTLTVTYTQNTATAGNVTIQAATLQ